MGLLESVERKRGKFWPADFNRPEAADQIWSLNVGLQPKPTLHSCLVVYSNHADCIFLT